LATPTLDRATQLTRRFCDSLYDVEIRRVICSTDEIVNSGAGVLRCCAPSLRPAASA
jgi:hypothetical protein